MLGQPPCDLGTPLGQRLAEHRRGGGAQAIGGECRDAIGGDPPIDNLPALGNALETGRHRLHVARTRLTASGDDPPRAAETYRLRTGTGRLQMSTPPAGRTKKASRRLARASTYAANAGAVVRIAS